MADVSESSLEIKIPSSFEMTAYCHFDRRDGCMDAEGRGSNAGAIAGCPSAVDGRPGILPPAVLAHPCAAQDVQEPSWSGCGETWLRF